MIATPTWGYGAPGINPSTPAERQVAQVVFERGEARDALAVHAEGQPPVAIVIAWSAQRRLHRPWSRLGARHKRRTIIAVAAARELASLGVGDHQEKIEEHLLDTPSSSRRLVGDCNRHLKEHDCGYRCHALQADSGQ